MHSVKTEHAPSPAGHYAQGIAHAGLVFIAGQLPIRPDGTRITGSIEEQTHQVISNVEAIAVAAGSSLDRLVKVTVYIADIGLWGRVNAVYAQRFGAATPARAIVPTLPLHHGFLIEMDAIGAVGGA